MDRLRNIAAVLQKETRDFGELVQTLEDYADLVLELSQVEMHTWDNRQNRRHDNGIALGTTWAAHCIRDLGRTKAFIKGFFEAITYLQGQKSGTLEVLYLGTGPFATLALPIMASYPPETVQFTLYEVNPSSFESAHRVIEALGFQESVKDFRNEDATTCRLDPDASYDLCLCETMQRALENEQQVPIMMNILPQLKKHTLLLPQKITIDLCLVNYGKFRTDPSCCHRLGSVFELSREMMATYEDKIKKESGRFLFPTNTFSCSYDSSTELNCLALLTEIQVWGKEQIGFMESAITLPYTLKDFTDEDQKMEVEIRYVVDEKPGFTYQIHEKE